MQQNHKYDKEICIRHEQLLNQENKIIELTVKLKQIRSYFRTNINVVDVCDLKYNDVFTTLRRMKDSTRVGCDILMDIEENIDSLTSLMNKNKTNKTIL